MFFLMAVFACLFSMVFTPLAARIGRRIGALDVPTDWRRMHKEAIPRCGGIAIFLSFSLSCLAVCRGGSFFSSLLVGGAILFFLGLTDDVFCVSAWVKLAVQTVAAVFAVLLSGIGGRGVIFAVLWLLLLTNAHNFVDGLDGLFAGVAAMEGVSLCVIFLILGKENYALPSLLLAAACLGFRHFNRFPARIFAGDCGSETVGFLLGILSLPLFWEIPVGIGDLTPLFLFAYPLTDLSTAVLRRLLRGKSPFSADRAHLHHRVCDAGVPHPQCTNILLLISASMSGIAVLLCRERSFLYAGIACLLTAFLLIRLRTFIGQFA